MNRTTSPPVSDVPTGRLTLLKMIASALSIALLGCQSRAHTDLYRQRMASEIRVLEDQLYEADYENRVLRDKLDRCKTAQHPPPYSVPSSEPMEAAEIVPAPKPRTDEPIGVEPRAEPESVDLEPEMESDMDDLDEMESIDELGLPSIDEGTPVEPGALTDPAAEPEERLLPAPGGPQPPGKRDTEIPDVQPGDLLPPSMSEDDDVKPPGQIKLESVRAVGTPTSLRIHPELSGGQRIDGQIQGMTIVVNVLDSLGKTVDLERFDVDAELSVVILDPDLEPSQARIGRWDFSPQQVAGLVRSGPISGFHIPVIWQEVQPSGDEVIVHVRLRANDDQLQSETRLRVERKPAIAEWTPRSQSRR